MKISFVVLVGLVSVGIAIPIKKDSGVSSKNMLIDLIEVAKEVQLQAEKRRGPCASKMFEPILKACIPQVKAKRMPDFAVGALDLLGSMKKKALTDFNAGSMEPLGYFKKDVPDFSAAGMDTIDWVKKDVPDFSAAGMDTIDWMKKDDEKQRKQDFNFPGK